MSMHSLVILTGRRSLSLLGPTCLHQVLHGGKPLVDRCADRAVDEHTGQVDVAHQCSSGQPGGLIGSTNVTSY